MVNIINIIKQKLGIRTKRDIQENLRVAKDDEQIAKQEYESAEAEYHSAVWERTQSEAKYKSQYNIQRDMCYRAAQNPEDIILKRQCTKETQKRNAMAAQLNIAIENERIAKNNYDDKVLCYKKAIAQRETFQKEYDSYKYPI